MRIAATRLAKERERRGMSQTQLASLLGISRSALSNVENGHVAAWPRLRRTAARTLGVSEESLFETGDKGGLDE